MSDFLHTPIERWDEYFDVLRSMRYHRKRQRFFEFQHLWATFFGVVLGSGAFIAISANSKSAGWIALGSALISALTLVVRPSERARRHADLHDKFSDLAKQLNVRRALTDVELEKIIEARCDIEKTESPHLRSLNEICYYETAMALGVDAKPPGMFTKFHSWLW